MQRSASRSRSRHCLTQTLHKEGHRPSVELDDVVPDHPRVQLALREHGLAAHVEKRADALAVGQGEREQVRDHERLDVCLLYTSPSPRDGLLSRMPSSA